MPRSRLVAVLAFVMVLASGCRFDSWMDSNRVAKLPPQEILRSATDGAAQAGSVRVQGRLVAGGQQVWIDMRLVRDSSATGVIRMGAHTIELVRSGQVVYVKGSEGFYASIGVRALPRQFRGKYLKVAASDPEFAGLAELTDMQRLFDVLLASPTPLTRGGKERVNGRRAIALLEQSGARRTVYVALQERPLPLRIRTSPGSPETESIDFLDYDQPFGVAPPAAGTVVDIGKLIKAAA